MNKDSTNKDTLVISEMFKSFQGEGHTMGEKAYFFRLTACNLFCGLKQETFSKANKENWSQDKIKENMASDANWCCDSFASWMKGGKYSFHGIINKLYKEVGILKDLQEGTRLIFTGGEPALQQEGIIHFLKYLESEYTIRPICEIETNGTIRLSGELLSRVKYINISPKLSNSAMPKEQRIIPQNINRFVYEISENLFNKVMFKFVVLDMKDIEEVINDYHIPFKIPHNQIWLMPAADNREDLRKLGPWVLERAKELNFNYSHRLHIEIYDKMTGV